MVDGQFSQISGIADNQRRSVFVLLVVAVLCFLPGFFSIPAVDRDEARYAQATRQMVSSGDWIDIRLQEKPRHKQPIGIYWLQAAAVSMFGERGIAPIWVHRLPSLFGAVAAVLLTYWVALPLVGVRAAFISGLLVAGSLILTVEARLAKTDAVLLASVVLAQGAMVRAFLGIERPGSVRERGGHLPILFWTAMAVGTLVKGPLIFLFVGLTALVLTTTQRSARFLARLRPWPWIVWFLVLTLPWYIAIGFATEGEFYRKAIGFSVLGKISQGHEGHGAPPLTHFAWFWAIFWPGSLLFAACIPEIWKRRSEPWLAYLLCWIVPAWLVFELITTKLPHYLLPSFPAIAIATAGILVSRGFIVHGTLARGLLKTAVVLSAIAGICAAVLAGWMADDQMVTMRFGLISLGAVVGIAVCASIALRALSADDLLRFATALVAGLVVFYAAVLSSVSRIELIWPGPRIAEVIQGARQCDRPALVAAGYDEASLVFNTRTDIELADGPRAAAVLAEQDCVIAIVEQGQRPAFAAQATELGIKPVEVGRVTGFNIGGGRPLDILLFRVN